MAESARNSTARTIRIAPAISFPPLLDRSRRCFLLVPPQLAAEHLADHRLRERAAKLDQLGYVVAGQPLAGVRHPRLQLLGCEGRAGSQDRIRLHGLARV